MLLAEDKVVWLMVGMLHELSHTVYDFYQHICSLCSKMGLNGPSSFDLLTITDSLTITHHVFEIGEVM